MEQTVCALCGVNVAIGEMHNLCNGKILKICGECCDKIWGDDEDPEKEVKPMNVDIVRQLNEIPPTWIVEQLARVYGEEIWDKTRFRNLTARGFSLGHPEEKGVVELVCYFCNKPSLMFEQEPEEIRQVEIVRKHFRNRISREVHVFWIGQCEGCGTIYWGQE